MRPDLTQTALDSYWYIIRRVREELDTGNPSSHAVSQLANALNSALNLIDLIRDTRAPTRSRSERINMDVSVTNGFEKLTSTELAVFLMLLEKTEGDAGSGLDLMPEIIQRYNAGTLAPADGPDHEEILEIEAVESDQAPDLYPPERW
jgi:hypothetical protein